ncbi:sulfate/molybdate ABC transporter ATP-binding protein [Enemella evansiae]|uniref:sulfate/molybdate ABC transporter ATP-binding protein n=1 Tax=Enemella evansiae TaxID=2016499 RepID=UPI000B97C5B3|nr:ABC transporter ATP-binding protein [Enemella evansiae]OYN96949.1 molybdenum ABC transporter ATP-binding protein [Enemella evansiae]OYO06209.1 molybdenum ABC transporter ATP-binding protein [Enemella evansiae]OYO11897.1 molybdenum ABC transporter ATP-binding protein [Enemella evansiae]PFG68940.1 molybdate transport system ATP-binding protein [Propionibacteriaceae bacterium ES.041]
MTWFSARVRHEQRSVQAELTLDEGEVVAVVGPNGAGKSTLLKVIAGLLEADDGALELAGDDLWGVPAHRRRIVSLTQQAMLFPHLDLTDNVGFAPRSAGAGRRESRARAQEFLTLVGIGELAGRKPAEVSGGQAQRAAIARALAAEPRLLLLDEPFAALDVEVAAELRQVLRRVLRDTGRTAVIVTHDLLDALALADRIIVLEQGEVVEQGPVRQVLSRPRSRFGARFAGVNLVSGRLIGHQLLAGATAVNGLLAGPITDTGPVPGLALFRPAAVSVHLQPPHGSPRNSWLVRLTALEAYAEGIRLRGRHEDLGDLSADITPAAAAELDLGIGDGCWFVVKAQEVELLER